MKHTWFGPYGDTWHCYQCGTTVQHTATGPPAEAGCPVTTDDFAHQLRTNPSRSLSCRTILLIVDALIEERNEARAEIERLQRKVRRLEQTIRDR